MIKYVRNIVDKVANSLFDKASIIIDSKISKLLNDADKKTVENSLQVYYDEVHMKNIEKRKCFEEALQQGVASLHFDPRMEGVSVPEKYSSNEELILNYSYNYGIPDFFIDDKEVIATLSFGGFPYKCVVPWESVIIIMSASPPAEKKHVKQKVKLEVHTNKDYVEKSDKPSPKLTLIKGGKS
jgi:stringent starvation protein B